MADAGETPLSVHRPDGTPRGGVVVVQEAFGVNDHIEDIGRRLAAEGWLAVVPHLFHRTGDPAFGYEDFSVVMPHMKALTAEGILTDVDAALACLEGEGVPAARTGIVGFCMGGTVALVVAARRPIGAAVTFYGGGVTSGRFGFPPLVEVAPDISIPWLGLFGDADQGIPVEDVEQLRAAAATAGAETEIVRYPGAPHGFNCDIRDSYRPEPAADAWARTLAWFDRHLS
jgi:carboxymethylenebutenolidase